MDGSVRAITRPGRRADAGSQRSPVAREAARSAQAPARRGQVMERNVASARGRRAGARHRRRRSPRTSIAMQRRRDQRARARAELRAISTRLDGARSQVLIEASEPVAYVTSQPDPLTVLVDLRNVKAGHAAAGHLGPLPPVADVRVEEAVGRRRRRRGARPRQARLSRRRIACAARATSSTSTSIAASCRTRRSRGADGRARSRRCPLAPGKPHRAVAACQRHRRRRPHPSPARSGSSRRSDRAAAECPALPGSPGHARFPGRRPARGAAHVRRNQRPEHRHRSDHHRHGRRVAADVPWDQALDIILKANKLGYAVDGTVVRIAPIDGAGAGRRRAPQAVRGAGAAPASCAC